MARIVCGSLTTFNLSTHLDAMTADLYGVADYFSTPGYVGSGPQLYLSGSNFFGIGASYTGCRCNGATRADGSGDCQY